MDLGKLGVRVMSDGMGAADAARLATRAEGWGYKTLWIPEAFGRNVVAHAAWLLSQTSRLNIATGIANTYARDPRAALSAQNSLNEQWNGRFLLGLGVSHAPIVEDARGHTYAKPIETMIAYLEGMKKVTNYMAPMPTEKPKTIIAALGPKMLEVAAKYADGAHPYLTTPEHTAEARKILGPGKLLCPEQFITLETDPVKAREIGRQQIGMSLRLTNYQNSAKRQGFSAAEIESRADRMVDALVAWGSPEKIRAHVQRHFDAGADHVILQEIPYTQTAGQLEKAFELFAPGK